MENIPTICPNCGNKLFHNKGISKKNNKPYENFKCGSCEYIKWVDLIDKPASEKPTDLQMIMDTLTAIDRGQREIWKLLTKIYEDKNI